jgi:hypothetical protein
MSAASIRLKPPRYSLVSANGPSTAGVADAHRLGRGGRFKLLRVQQLSLRAQLVGVLDADAHARVELTCRQGVQQAVVDVDHQQVFHGVLDGNEGPLPTLLGIGAVGTGSMGAAEHQLVIPAQE